MEMTLAKSLKLKNKVAGEIRAIEEKIMGSNSSLVAAVENFNVRDLDSEREKKVGFLMKLKTEIAKANGPIFGAINGIAEAKATITYLSNLPTKEGVFTDYGYGDKVRSETWKVVISAKEVFEKIKKQEAEIERLQEEIDEFNHKTKIIVE